MEVRCCYRLIKNGEVIHSFYNTDTKEVYGMPKEFIDVSKLILPEYNWICYAGTDTEFDKTCEAILLSSSEFALVIEANNQGYDVLQFNGFHRYMRTAMDDDMKGHDSYIPSTNQFRPIGYRATQLIQYRSCDGIYRLTYSMNDGLVYTNDGALTPMFDVNSLDKISYNYAGYKDMIAKGYYAVVYQNGMPVFLQRTNDNKLIIV